MKALKRIFVLMLITAVTSAYLGIDAFAANTGKTVVSWEWAGEGSSDSSLCYVEKEELWEFVVKEPFPSEGSLKDRLPSAIHAQIRNEPDGTIASDTVGLQWKIERCHPEENEAGSCVATATLSGDYSLGKNTAPLEIAVKFPGEAATEELLEKNTLDNIETPGTVINMFDYWLGEDRYSDKDPTEYSDKTHTKNLGNKVSDYGINKGRTLVFSNGTGNGQRYYNFWDEKQAETPFSHRAGRKGVEDKQMITRVLQEKYPAIKLDWNDRLKPTPESLAYLFDPRVHDDHKKSFRNVKGLLQLDKDGYYYYDSLQNYAFLDENSGNIKLYDRPGVYEDDRRKAGQFFPFDDPIKQDVFLSTGDGGIAANPEKNAREDDNTFNHYFGLTMTSRFVQKENGTAFNGDDIIYEFSGDDDVWLYIDDVLIADLGGLHNAASFKINFADGKVLITDPSGEKVFLETTIKEQFEKAKANYGYEYDKEFFREDTFANGTYHTLRFFYLERGNSASNLRLKYNLRAIPASELEKVDQTNMPVKNAEFSLYAADEDYNYDDGETLYTAVTDDNGEFTFIDNETQAPLTFIEFVQASGKNHFVLKETGVPEGYRGGAELHLYLEKGALMSEDYWDTGAYAQAKVTATAPNKVKGRGADGNSFELDLLDEKRSTAGKLFAVVFKRLDMEKPFDDRTNWAPITGSMEKGWNVHSGSSWDDIIEAAQIQPYVFDLSTSGAYQVEIEDLPGDVKTYYALIEKDSAGEEAVSEEDAQFTVSYYYTKAETIEDASEANTYLLEPEQFGREFSAKLYVPNPKNRLVVQKVNKEKQPLDGAEFSLYYASDVEVYPDGTYEIKDGALPYDSLTTRSLDKEKDWIALEGAGVFPTAGKPLNKGSYYIIETKAPEGYEVNPKAVAVAVDDTGVYADAGTDNDGITVHRGVGRLMKSMLQFAADDDVDATLHDVKAQLLTSEKAPYEDAFDGWSKWKNDAQKNEELHLRYDPGSAQLEYTPSEESGHTQAATLSVETGWSKLEIRQCLAHDEKTDAYKENLGEKPLTNLFSGTLLVQVENQRTDENSGRLEISKSVTGPDGDKNKEFTFTVTLTDSSGTPLSGGYPYSGDKTGLIKNGGSIKLADGQYVTISDLPDGASYNVTEKEANEDGYETVSTGDSGKIKKQETAKAGFVNNRDLTSVEPTDPDDPEEPTDSHETDDQKSDGEQKKNTEEELSAPKTADTLHLNVYLLLCITALAGMGVYVIRAARGVKKRKSKILCRPRDNIDDDVR